MIGDHSCGSTTCILGHTGQGVGPCHCLDEIPPEKRVRVRAGIAALRAELKSAIESLDECRATLENKAVANDALLAKLQSEQKELVTRQAQALAAFEARDVWRAAAQRIIKLLAAACQAEEERCLRNGPEQGMGLHSPVPALTTKKILEIIQDGEPRPEDVSGPGRDGDPRVDAAHRVAAAIENWRTMGVLCMATYKKSATDLTEKALDQLREFMAPRYIVLDTMADDLPGQTREQTERCRASLHNLLRAIQDYRAHAAFEMTTRALRRDGQ